VNIPRHDELQWRHLRRLRAERAREALAQAGRQHDLAQQQVHSREARIQSHRDALRELDRQRSEEWAPQLPRWAVTISRHRERLFEQFERESYALIDDRQQLAKAREALQRRHAELARALAREEAMQTLLDTHHRQQRRATDRQVQRTLDDRPRKALGGRHA
jgi:hypothetical protein